MNIKRVTTALIGFPLVALVLIFGNIYIVDIAFSIIAIMALYEYFHAFKSKEKANPVTWIGYVLAAAISLIHVIPTEYTKNALQLLLPSIVVVLFLMVIVSDMKINVKDIAITLLGIIYILGFIVFRDLYSLAHLNLKLLFFMGVIMLLGFCIYQFNYYIYLKWFSKEI